MIVSSLTSFRQIVVICRLSLFVAGAARPSTATSSSPTPEKFLPQYGGYCAYAISLNLIADIEPEDWAIVNGKLYLNNGFFAQALWSFDKSGNVARGDRNWPLVPKPGESKS